MSFSSARQPESATKNAELKDSAPGAGSQSIGDKANAAPTSGEQQAKSDVTAEKHWGTTQKYQTEEEAYGQDAGKERK
ncbi:hypothetical protein HDU86_004366 [Geranomyces michiganensis]|nr:hypothetical protein HDU86_004366 [Geranomyces michiganensis]